MTGRERPATLVVGVGNELRGDDAAGLEIARRVRERADGCCDVVEIQGELTELLEIWTGRDTVVIVDTTRSGAPPGTIRRLDGADAALSAQLRGSASSHLVGLQDAIALARALDRLPANLIVFGVEGVQFATGQRLSPELEAVLPTVVDLVLRESC